MKVRVIIAGSRGITDYDILLDAIKQSSFEITEVVSGIADGIDMLGETYAREKGLPVKRFPPDWKRLGKNAGPIRNKQMAEYAEAAIIIWDGRSPGTKNMIKTAKQHNITTFIKVIG